MTRVRLLDRYIDSYISTACMGCSLLIRKTTTQERHVKQMKISSVSIIDLMPD
jgi:hypothetical protein